VRKGFTAFANEDVIVAKITPCFENGKAALCRGLTNGLGFGSTEFHVLRCTDAVIPEYVYHFVRQESFRRDGEANMTGSVGQKRVPADWLKAVEIPLAPLAEQRRIVAKVDAVLARVNAARQRLGRVPALLKRFRQSVIAAACSGRLTADWRDKNPDATSSSDLVSSIIKEHGYAREVDDLTIDDLPKTWDCATLGELTKPGNSRKPFVTSGSRGWADLVGSKGSYFIRSECINTDHIRFDENVRVNAPDGAESDRTRVQPFDLLLTITGNNVGRTAVVPAECAKAYVSQHVAIIRVSRKVDVRFIWMWLRSPAHGQDQLQQFYYGYTKPGLNLEQIRSIRVGVPPFDEQREIVRRVDALFELADKIEARVTAATIRADKLIHATLAKAFRGELVPTEAELAELEGREFETAQALLDRIHDERNRMAPSLGQNGLRRSASVARKAELRIE
jgi:type I restriction enzyme S subunit